MVFFAEPMFSSRYYNHNARDNYDYNNDKNCCSKFKFSMDSIMHVWLDNNNCQTVETSFKLNLLGFF